MDTGRQSVEAVRGARMRTDAHGHTRQSVFIHSTLTGYSIFADLSNSSAPAYILDFAHLSTFSKCLTTPRHMGNVSEA